MKVHLAVPYGPHRYGPGKIHILTRESQYVYTVCGRVPHASIRIGPAEEATCSRCNPAAAKQAADLALYDAIFGAWDREHDAVVGGTLKPGSPKSTSVERDLKPARPGIQTAPI